LLREPATLNALKRSIDERIDIMNLRPFFPALTNSRRPTRPAKWLALIGVTLLAVTAANATDRVWIGGTGLWDAAANWSPAQVPGPADNVFITNVGTYTVTIDKPDVDPAIISSLILGGASGTQTLSVGNVVLTLNGTSVVNTNGHLDLTLASSELVGPGSVTVNGTVCVPLLPSATIPPSAIVSVGVCGTTIGALVAIRVVPPLAYKRSS
jgi:hypothetical protein